MAVRTRLSHVAEELDVSILELIKLAKKCGVSHTPTEEEVAKLRRGISGYYDLSDYEIRELETYLKTDEASRILEESAPLFDHLDQADSKRYLEHIAQRLFESMPAESELKGKIRPATVMETILNLGVIEMYRSKAGNKKRDAPPVELLRFDQGIAQRVFKGYFLRKLGRIRISSQEDFQKARNELHSLYQELIKYAT